MSRHKYLDNDSIHGIRQPLTGSGIPGPTGTNTTPEVVGQFYIDTATSDVYRSTGLTSGDWVIFASTGTPGSLADAEIYFPVNGAGNYGDYDVKSVTTNAGANFSFAVPYDFVSLVDIAAILTPEVGAIGTGKDIDLFSDYGAIGEPTNQHDESDNTSTYDLVSGFNELDLSGVFTALSAGDICGVNIKQNSVGGTVHYFWIRLRYARA